MLVDYTSGCRKTDMAKYPKHIAKIIEKYDKEDGNFDMYLLIIYTGDVEKADPVFDCGCLTLRPIQIFLSRMMVGKDWMPPGRRSIQPCRLQTAT